MNRAYPSTPPTILAALRMSNDRGAAIQFPSPSVLLRPDSPPAAGTSSAGIQDGQAAESLRLQPKAKAKAPPAKPKQPIRTAADGPMKPKQSKSRNGCVTCKQKRLKCDETKPTCQQCQKRQVECGGYKKDFKWRPFEESSFVHRSAPPKPKKPEVVSNDRPGSKRVNRSPSVSEHSSSEITPKRNSNSPPLRNARRSNSGPSPPRPTASVPVQRVDRSGGRADQHSPPARSSDSPSFHVGVKREEIDFKKPPNPTPPSRRPVKASRSDSPPRRLDQSPPNDLPRSLPTEPEQNHPTSLEKAGTDSGPYPDPELDDLDDLEALLRESDPNGWSLPGGLDFSNPLDFENLDLDLIETIMNQPKLSAETAEILLNGFDKQTCGILSIRDGPNENPWRTAILPLVQESESLYHAIASITAFHASKVNPELKDSGVEHMRKSVKLLAEDIQNMRPDIGLAITLLLAFAESWDVHVSTGMQHLQGAKQFIGQALPIVQQLGPNHDFSRRIKFLCGVWVYMDVIARLTNFEADESTDFDTILDLPSDGDDHAEIDPLMGCATTLFPLIGRVANLVRKVCKSNSNSIQSISQANELKAAIERWSPPFYLNEPEDDTCDIQDSLRTAEAYRWATLLHLHQAVPELPSMSSAELAKNALVQLALVPLTSSTIIVQIYPLFAAGCEAATAEDREWVTERWEAMSRRMLVGNIDRCLEVVREVWDRRDEYDAATARPQSSRRESGPGQGRQSGWLSDLRGGPNDNTLSSPTRGLSGINRLTLSGDSDHSDRFSPDGPPSDLLWGGGPPPPPAPPLPKSPFDPDRRQSGWQRPPPPAPPLPPPGWRSGMGYSSNNAHSFPLRLRPPPQGPRKRNSARDDELAFERSVRGRQHWCGVMRDWNWEVLL